MSVFLDITSGYTGRVAITSNYFMVDRGGGYRGYQSAALITIITNTYTLSQTLMLHVKLNHMLYYPTITITHIPTVTINLLSVLYSYILQLHKTQAN